MLQNKLLENEVQRLKTAVEELTVLNDLAIAASSALEVDQILDLIMQKSVKAVHAEQGSIMLVTPKQESPLQTLIRHKDFSGSLQSYKVGTFIVGWVLKNKQPLIIENLANDERFHVTEDELREVKTLLCVPIMLKGKIIGILTMTNKKTGEPFNDNDMRLLSIIAAQSGQLIRNSQLQAESIEKKRLEHELQMAQQIQQSLLPDNVPSIQKLDIANYFKPTDAVGGDYYDYIMFDDQNIGVVIADVSGHGPSAALVMTMLKGILHSITQKFISADQTIVELNSIINRIVPPEVFITMMFLIFDLKKKIFQFSNAGHNPLLYYNKKENKCTMLELSGCALNLTKDPKYSVKEISFNTGDVFLVYTDGVIEATNDKEEMFGIKRLIKFLAKASDNQAIILINHIKEQLNVFSGNKSPEDDIVLIAIKIKE
jgi:sigma-B regulation protein RsbU (phosphoserine phosphatase)